MKPEKNKQYPTFKTAEVVVLVIITCFVSLLMGIIITNPNKNIDYQLTKADKELQFDLVRITV